MVNINLLSEKIKSKRNKRISEIFGKKEVSLLDVLSCAFSGLAVVYYFTAFIFMFTVIIAGWKYILYGG